MLFALICCLFNFVSTEPTEVIHSGTLAMVFCGVYKCMYDMLNMLILLILI